MAALLEEAMSQDEIGGLMAGGLAAEADALPAEPGIGCPGGV